MKKTLSILVIAMLILVSNMGIVRAADNSKTQDALYVELSTADKATKVTVGESIGVKIDIKGFKQDKLAITTLNAEFEYDKAIFEEINEKTSFELGDGWSGAKYHDATGKLIIDYASAQIEDTTMGTVMFKVKEGATKTGETTITIKNIVASDGHEDITMVDKSITITVEAAAVATPTPTAAPTAEPTAIPTAAPTAKTSTVPATAIPTAKASAMPQTGIEGLEALQVYALPIIVAVAVIGIFAYVRYNRMDK